MFLMVYWLLPISDTVKLIRFRMSKQLKAVDCSFFCDQADAIQIHVLPLDFLYKQCALCTERALRTTESRALCKKVSRAILPVPISSCKGRIVFVLPHDMQCKDYNPWTPQGTWDNNSNSYQEYSARTHDAQ